MTTHPHFRPERAVAITMTQCIARATHDPDQTQGVCMDYDILTTKTADGWASALVDVDTKNELRLLICKQGEPPRHQPVNFEEDGETYFGIVSFVLDAERAIRAQDNFESAEDAMTACYVGPAPLADKGK